MGRPGGPGPLDPIFDVETEYGVLAFNNTPGVTRLTCTINQASGQPDPTGIQPVLFTAVFSEAVTGFETGDVSISGSAGATTQVVTEVAPFDGTTYQVAVSGATSQGTIIASIPSFVCASVDDATPNSASTSTDNSITFQAPQCGTIVETIDFAAANMNPPDCVIVNENVLYVMGVQADHRVVNISDPLNLSVYATVTRSSEQAWVALIDTDIVLVPIGSTAGTAGVRSISLATPSAPATVSTLMNANLEGQTKGYAFNGTHLILENNPVGTKDLVAVNVSNPASMSQADALVDSQGPASRLVYDGRYIYAPSASNDNFRIYDANTFTAPTLVGTVGGLNNCIYPVIIPDPVETQYVIVSFLTAGDPELRVIDVSTKTAPTLSTQIANVGVPLVYANGTLIVANNTTMRFYDTSALPALTEIYSFAHGLGQIPGNVAWDGGLYVYLPYAPSNLAVMELTC